MQVNSAHKYLLVPEAAALLEVSAVTIRRWTKGGKLPKVQPGLKILIPQTAVRALVAERRARPAPTRTAPGARRRRRRRRRPKTKAWLRRHKLPELEDLEPPSVPIVSDYSLTAATGPEAVSQERDLRAAITEALKLLLPDDRFCIEAHFGLADHPPRTLEAVGALLGVTRERVRERIKRALRVLRSPGPARELLRGDAADLQSATVAFTLACLELGRKCQHGYTAELRVGELYVDGYQTSGCPVCHRCAACGQVGSGRGWYGSSGRLKQLEVTLGSGRRFVCLLCDVCRGNAERLEDIELSIVTTCKDGT